MSLVFLISFVFLTMASQDRCLVFFFYINETHTILCGLFKNIKKNSYNKKKKKQLVAQNKDNLTQDDFKK